jgi:5'-nucleotidase
MTVNRRMTPSPGRRGTLTAMSRLISLAAAIVAAALLAPAQAGAQRPTAPPNVQVQLLGINDFHGHLEATTPGQISPTGGTTDRVAAGGAEYLATHLRRLSEGVTHSTTLAVGDNIGGSPLLSSLFHDEPTIEAMNRMDFEFSPVGNHEFDEGAAELRRIQRGGCHREDGCQDGTPFEGAAFQYLAANVVDEARGRPLFPPYAIRRYSGIRVGFIGLVLQDTPSIVSPAGVRGLRFLDEAETANRYARELLERGVQAIVVLVHQGGQPAQAGGINECKGGLQGEIRGIVDRLHREVDVVMSAHSHTSFICDVNGLLVTQGASFGRLITDVDLTLGRRTRDVLRATATNRIVTQDVPKAADITAIIERYNAIAAPLRDRPVGRIAGPIARAADDSGESAAGNFIADAQLAATDDPDTGGAVAAFMNPGGVRADFTFAPSGAEGEGVVTYGESFTVQPFGNSLVTLTLTGAQIRELLKQQWCGQTGGARILAPSSTVSYTFDRSVAAEIVGKPCADAANPVSDLTIGGAPVEDAASYRITVNSFLAEGGDRFTVLTQGTDRLGGAVDLDALEAYLTGTLEGTPQAVPATDRIDVVE